MDNVGNENIEIFKAVKREAEIFYNNITSVYCPYFKKNIIFNSKGFKHVMMKSWDQPRLISEQYLRFKFLKLVPKTLKLTHTLQEVREEKAVGMVKSCGERKLRAKMTRYYGFIAIINNVRIKIVIKHINNGELFFWSVIPFWKNQKDELTGKIKKVFHEGDLETQ
ncbi:MAG: hypothetical protein ACYC40_04195 [Patescibacteria group bacterium]